MSIAKWNYLNFLSYIENLIRDKVLFSAQNCQIFFLKFVLRMKNIADVWWKF